ncbi:MAG: hypothetical protein ACI93R_002040 [Flavobacteriales bacterium]|jgi:hypothetical protein
MKKLVLATTIAVLTSAYAQADSYQVEIGATYGQSETGSFESDIYTLDGEVFFAEVDTSKGSLAEASFLDKASGLGLTYATTSPETGDSVDAWATGLRVVTGGDLIIEASYADSDDDSAFGIGIGTYLNDNTDIVVSYETADEADLDTLAVDLHSVVSLSGDSSLAYNVGASYIDANDSGYGIAGELTYYVNNNLGFGGVVGYTSVGDSDLTTFGVKADYFVNSTIRLRAMYSTAEANSFDTDTFTLGASARF